MLWSQVEGRLMPMLEGVEDLRLEALNEATQAWIELEYNRALHSELGCSPLERALGERSVALPSPTAEELRRAFRATFLRTQRRSDGTVSLLGRRFEVPSAFRHLQRLCLRCARWDLGSVELVDERSRAVLARLWPLDRTRNADGRRRAVLQEPAEPGEAPAGGLAPLLRDLLARYAATGLPPAYLPHHASVRDEEEKR